MPRKGLPEIRVHTVGYSRYRYSAVPDHVQRRSAGVPACVPFSRLRRRARRRGRARVEECAPARLDRAVGHEGVGLAHQGDHLRASRLGGGDGPEAERSPVGTEFGEGGGSAIDRRPKGLDLVLGDPGLGAIGGGNAAGSSQLASTPPSLPRPLPEPTPLALREHDGLERAFLLGQEPAAGGGVPIAAVGAAEPERAPGIHAHELLPATPWAASIGPGRPQGRDHHPQDRDRHARAEDQPQDSAGSLHHDPKAPRHRTEHGGRQQVARPRRAARCGPGRRARSGFAGRGAHFSEPEGTPRSA